MQLCMRVLGLGLRLRLLRKRYMVSLVLHRLAILITLLLHLVHHLEPG